MAAKKQLSEEAKRFIVKSLAVFDSPSDVMDAVKEKFKVTITRAGIQTYDPTKVMGEDLSDELKQLFSIARAEYDKKAAEELPLLKMHNRVKKLSKYVEGAESDGNTIAASAFIEQIAKEEGGAFTNRKEITGAKGGPVQIHSKSFDDWNKDADARTSEAAAVMEMFDDGN